MMVVYGYGGDFMRQFITPKYTTADKIKSVRKKLGLTQKEFAEFIESRCFPRERDKMKLILKDLNIPFYDPIMIIKKTEGRMAEDNFWIKIEL